MSSTSPTAAAGPLSPLREPVFRRIWSASVVGNLGQLILGVGAAWEMTRLTSSPTMVALVQTAMMLPLMLASLPAGAIADTYDRRKVAMGGLTISIIAASTLSMLAWFGLATPWTLLTFCFLIGIGVAIYSPAWSSSIHEQVSAQHLPAAVALGTISYNVARSFGPAVGGLIVLAFGAQAAFGLNALLYFPLLLAFMLWRREQAAPRFPPESLHRAIISGTRYVFHAPILRRTLTRAFLFGLVNATATALAPLIAKDILGGDAAIYGILLGAGGAGAVFGALFVSTLRARFGTEKAVRLLHPLGGAALILAGVSTNLYVTCLAMFISGACNILVIALYNVAVQLSAPRWVLARSLSLFASCITGGIALGAFVWGEVSGNFSIETAMVASGVLMICLPLLSLFMPLTDLAPEQIESVEMTHEPDLALAITMRSGPVVIEIDYRVAEEDAREFYNRAQELRPLRLRNGGYAWSLARDVADPLLWTERYVCPTWADYLRVRGRQTLADREAQASVTQLLLDHGAFAVRRRLERPEGSVRWRADTPDNPNADTGYLAP